MSRELWETVTELVGGLAALQGGGAGVRITGMELELPVEMVVVQTRVGFRLLVDAPHFRWNPGLRPRTGRLGLVVQRVDADELAWIVGQQDGACRV
jgi:hypothetical protein